LVAVPGALAGIVLAGVGAAIGQSITGSSTSGLSDVLGEAGLWVAMLATVVLVSYRFGTKSLQRDFGLAITVKDPLWGLGAAVTAFVGAGLVLELFSGSKFSGSNDQILTQQKGHAAGIILVTLIVALGAPFFEELFFRGYLRTALQARFGRHGAVWLQAVFFGLAHAGEASTALGNVSVVLAMFTVGVVLGYTAMLTGRLGAGMVGHCLFNLVAVVSVL
jgi:membrane protease YdiL (CAAX protease family)